MARRRRHEEEHENHERWLVSYADFITLLFAFFVVMYSLSSINEGKYRVLSDSIVQAFRSLNINESGQQIILPPVAVAPVVRPQPPAPSQLEESAEAVRRQTAQQMRSMAEDIRRVLAPLTRSGQVSVSEGAFGISIEINASLLFAPGEAMLSTLRSRHCGRSRRCWRPRLFRSRSKATPTTCRSAPTASRRTGSFRQCVPRR